MLNVPRLSSVGHSHCISLFARHRRRCRARDGRRPSLARRLPGYNAANVKIDGPRLSANLALAGKPRNVFGNDVKGSRSGRGVRNWYVDASVHDMTKNKGATYTLRSPQIRLPAIHRGPDVHPDAGQIKFTYTLAPSSFNISRASRPSTGGAVHDRTRPAHLRAAVPHWQAAPQDDTSTHERLRPRRVC